MLWEKEKEKARFLKVHKKQNIPKNNSMKKTKTRNEEERGQKTSKNYFLEYFFVFCFCFCFRFCFCFCFCFCVVLLGDWDSTFSFSIFSFPTLSLFPHPRRCTQPPPLPVPLQTKIDFCSMPLLSLFPSLLQPFLTKNKMLIG